LVEIKASHFLLLLLLYKEASTINTFTLFSEVSGTITFLIIDEESKKRNFLQLKLGELRNRYTVSFEKSLLFAEQASIAGCAGGNYKNICAAADIRTGKSIGTGEFALSVYP
jgi:hypothetical protein